jgi:hypothetical protein
MLRAPVDSGSWYDVWLDETLELVVGCVLLVLSGWWWFDSRGAITDGWRNVLSTLTVVLGPWFVQRAWKRRGGAALDTERAAAEGPVRVRDPELYHEHNIRTLHDADNFLRQYSPAEFLTTPDAAVECIYMVHAV